MVANNKFYPGINRGMSFFAYYFMNKSKKRKNSKAKIFYVMKEREMTNCMNYRTFEVKFTYSVIQKSRI